MLIKVIGTRKELLAAAGYNTMNPNTSVESVAPELKSRVIDALDDRYDLPGYNVEIEVVQGEDHE
uniref:Uncharacterized protein n=1 Tax=Serratia phage Kevin TaxID=3161161 RepID=A0AAU8KX73_9CAUD